LKKNRKETENFIIKYIKKLSGTDFNVNLYVDMFKKLSDKEFDMFMERLKNGEFILPLIVPHEEGATKVSLENTMKVAKDLGHDFFQHTITNPIDGGPKRKSKYKSFIHLAPMRRMKQTVAKGVSISENDKMRDSLTGQVSGISKSSSISYPELQLLISMGMDKSINELIKYRGGDEGAMRATKQALLRYGNVNGEFIDQYSTGVTSTATLKSYFNGMHLKVNL